MNKHMFILSLSDYTEVTLTWLLRIRWLERNIFFFGLTNLNNKAVLIAAVISLASALLLEKTDD